MEKLDVRDLPVARKLEREREMYIFA